MMTMIMRNIKKYLKHLYKILHYGFYSLNEFIIPFFIKIFLSINRDENDKKTENKKGICKSIKNFCKDFKYIIILIILSIILIILSIIFLPEPTLEKVEKEQIG